MNKIEAEYVTGSEENSFSGIGDVICPSCGKQMRETDICKVGEENGPREIEICGDCLSDAEGELEIRFDADIVPREIFQRLWDHLVAIVADRNANEPPNDVSHLARLLGGKPWQSGGGIWLVLVKRGDGAIVTISDEVACEYESEDALANGTTNLSIRLV
jgi:hypothetical protein